MSSSEEDNFSDSATSEYAIEVEEEEREFPRLRNSSNRVDECSSVDEDGPHQFDPNADEEFTVNYERELVKQQEKDNKLTRQFEKIEPVASW